MENFTNITNLEDHRIKNLDKVSNTEISGVSQIQNYIIGGVGAPINFELDDARKAILDINDSPTLNDGRALLRYAKVANLYIKNGQELIDPNIETNYQEESLEINSLIGRAACRELDIRLFFPDDEEIIKESVKICDNCSIKQACLSSAIENGESHGVWGGVQFIRNEY
ncbi:MAG: WhiB family transcriptional regulator [bacterium]